MAYDANVAALQNVVNRFSVVGGFDRIAVDGLWGPRTQKGTYSALTAIQGGKCASDGCPSDDDQSMAQNIVTQWDGTSGAARGIQMFLNGVADMMGLAHVMAPVPKPPVVIPPIPMAPFQASLLERFVALPLWQRIAIGVAAGLGLIWVHKRVTEHGALPVGKRR